MGYEIDDNEHNRQVMADIRAGVSENAYPGEAPHRAGYALIDNEASVAAGGCVVNELGGTDPMAKIDYEKKIAKRQRDLDTHWEAFNVIISKLREFGASDLYEQMKYHVNLVRVQTIQDEADMDANNRYANSTETINQALADQLESAHARIAELVALKTPAEQASAIATCHLEHHAELITALKGQNAFQREAIGKAKAALGGTEASIKLSDPEDIRKLEASRERVNNQT